MIRRLTVAFASGVIGLVVPIATPPAHATAGTDGPCVDDVGVTVIVDFGDLGGGVSARCAPTGGTTGLAVLDAAGISWEGTRPFPGLVCRIAGLPSAGTEPCVNAPPANVYWSYWMAPRGGSWCYSSFGAGNRTPPPGSMEGWSFARLQPGADARPPRFAPLPPVAGTTPNPITPGDCGSAAPTPTAATVAVTTSSASTAATTTSLPTTSGPTTSTSAPNPIGPATPPAAVSVDTDPPVTADVTGTAAADATTTAPSSPPTSAVIDASVSGASVAPTSSSAGGSTTASASVASSQGSVDLTRSRSSGGSVLTTVLGVGVLAAVGGAAVWAARRSRTA